MSNMIRPAIGLFLGLSVVTGLLYPLATTGVAQILFPHQANGSLIRDGERVTGSEIIGQSFTRPEYFWGRPSATGPAPYNAMASSGSNLATGNPALQEAVKECIATLRKYPVPAGAVPVDLVTTSASGLDPHISPAAALYQLPRVAAARGIDEGVLHELVNRYSEIPAPRFAGEARVNVLALNRALDKLARH